jgi:hypothetical protein
MLKSLPKGRKTVPHINPCDRLKALRQRAGYSRADMTRELGWAGPSNYKRYEEPVKNPEKPIPEHIVKKLFPLFVGRGMPPITHDEVAQLGPTSSGVQYSVGSRNSGYSTSPIVLTTAHGKNDLLTVRVRAERGVYVKSDISAADFGSSSMMADRQWPIEAQFCVAVMDDHAEGFGYPRGTALHCCFPTEFGAEMLFGKKVVMWLQHDRSGLGEMVVTKFKSNDNEEWVCEDALGKDVKGKPIGVIVAALKRE